MAFLPMQHRGSGARGIHQRATGVEQTSHQILLMVQRPGLIDLFGRVERLPRFEFVVVLDDESFTVLQRRPQFGTNHSAAKDLCHRKEGQGIMVE